MARVLFLTAWLACLGLMGACWTVWQDLADLALKPAELPILTVVIVLAPWIAGPGLLPWLRRMDSGGVNLPNAEHWFSGERRAASLTRLSPYLHVMGLMVMALLAAQIGLDLWYAQQGMKADDVVALSLLGLFLAATVVWTVAVMRAFPKPKAEASTAGDSAQPRRPRRPGEPH